ncbi:MAG: uracil-DNA glycosylase family protein, partial [Burkholderiales bacterium]
RPRPDEVRRCNGYLREELSALPDGAAILALGVIAHGAVVTAAGSTNTLHPFRHGARHALARGIVLFDSYHCSRYNTQTRRLTPAMFKGVFDAIRQHLAAAGFR